MAAKGSIAKADLMTYIRETLKAVNTFEECFSPDGKELRVDMIENGSPVQIKITFTAVKSPITNTPETQVINEKQFFITDEERVELEQTVEELGIRF